MATLAILFAGYSILCALALAVAHFGGGAYREQAQARRMGLALLVALATLQAVHVAWFELGADLTAGVPYRVALFAVAPAFYLFSRPLLAPGEPPPAAAWAHALPLAAAPWLPQDLTRPAAFLLGAGYLVVLGRLLLPLRAQRERFAVELALLGAAFVTAVGVVLLALLTVALPGAVPGTLPGSSFLALHAIAIGLGFLLVQTALGRRPQLPTEVREAAQARYASTTLGKVDTDDALRRLAALMEERRLYTDPELSLQGLADALGLSAHQLSELLNARLGKGFARLLREHRVGAAKRMLCEEPSASVLSVGLSVGFTSTSNFYEAFREIEGTTPGQYRKLARAA